MEKVQIFFSLLTYALHLLVTCLVFFFFGSSETHPFELVKSVHVLSAWWFTTPVVVHGFLPILEPTKFLDFASLFRDPMKPMDVTAFLCFKNGDFAGKWLEWWHDPWGFGPLLRCSLRNPYVPRVRDLKLHLPAFVPKNGAVQSLKMLGLSTFRQIRGRYGQQPNKSEGIPGFGVASNLWPHVVPTDYLLVPELDITLGSSIRIGMIQLKSVVGKITP